MTKLPLRTVARVLLIGFASYYLATGLVSVVLLLVVRTETGVVQISSISPNGERTNCPCVVWGRGLVFFPQPGDWGSEPKLGDQVSVLAYNEGYSPGVLKSRQVLRRVWERAVGLTALGLTLFGGLMVLNRRRSAERTNVTM